VLRLEVVEEHHVTRPPVEHEQVWRLGGWREQSLDERL
jgi:hypothetical protein